MSDRAHGTGYGDATGRAQVSDLYGLFTVSMMMSGERDGAAIMRLCASSFPSLGSLRVEAAYLNEADSMVPVDIGRDVPESLASQVAHAGQQGGRVDVDRSPWGWAMPLTSLSGCRGYLAVSAPEEPQKYELFLLDVLARQTAAALENAAPEITRVPRARDGVEAVPAMLSRLLEAHEIILSDAHDAAARVGKMGDDGTNDLLVSAVIRTGELETWFLAEHLVDTPLVRVSEDGAN